MHETKNKHRTEPPWNIVPHNEWENPLRRIILVSRKVIPEMPLKRATKTAWEAHCKGCAVVKRCTESWSNRIRISCKQRDWP
jgi:ATP-dependent Clp protease adapter protein ClpS